MSTEPSPPVTDSICIDGEVSAHDLVVFRAASETEQLLAIAALHGRLEVLGQHLAATNPASSVALLAVFVSIVALDLAGASERAGLPQGVLVVLSALLFIPLVYVVDRQHMKGRMERGHIAGRLAAYERICAGSDDA